MVPHGISPKQMAKTQEELQQLREREAQQRQKHEEQLKDMRCELEKNGISSG